MPRSARYFLSPGVPLYTVYVFDNGSACTQVPGRYIGSVNGNMIWAGLYLARATGDASYLSQAVATARAVTQHLGDGTGVYADLQAENDVTEPLIEAMYDMATAGRQGFARYWLLAAASAAASDLTTSGAPGGACRTRSCSPGAGSPRAGTPSRSGPAPQTPRKAARSST